MLIYSTRACNESFLDYIVAQRRVIHFFKRPFIFARPRGIRSFFFFFFAASVGKHKIGA